MAGKHCHRRLLPDNDDYDDASDHDDVAHAANNDEDIATMTWPANIVIVAYCLYNMQCVYDDDDDDDEIWQQSRGQQTLSSLPPI